MNFWPTTGTLFAQPFPSTPDRKRPVSPSKESPQNRLPSVAALQRLPQSAPRHLADTVRREERCSRPRRHEGLERQIRLCRNFSTGSLLQLRSAARGLHAPARSRIYYRVRSLLRSSAHSRITLGERRRPSQSAFGPLWGGCEWLVGGAGRREGAAMRLRRRSR